MNPIENLRKIFDTQRSQPPKNLHGFDMFAEHLIYNPPEAVSAKVVISPLFNHNQDIIYEVATIYSGKTIKKPINNGNRVIFRDSHGGLIDQKRPQLRIPTLVLEHFVTARTRLHTLHEIFPDMKLKTPLDYLKYRPRLRNRILKEIEEREIKSFDPAFAE